MNPVRRLRFSAGNEEGLQFSSTRLPRSFSHGDFSISPSLSPRCSSPPLFVLDVLEGLAVRRILIRYQQPRYSIASIYCNFIIDQEWRDGVYGQANQPWEEGERVLS